MKRRDFIAGGLGAGLAAAQPPQAPVRTAKVAKLFKAPDIHPNALEATADGLWIGDQVSERVFRVDWKTGKVLQEFQTEAHNTSGLAVGAGCLWISCNGGVSNRRPARPSDKPTGEVWQGDLKTGKTIKYHSLPWGDGIHGITFVEETQTLWMVALRLGVLVEVDPKDFRVTRMVAAKGLRPHGLDWEKGAIWCLYAGDRMAQKLDARSGRVLDTIKISNDDPDPHGMCIHSGGMYYCDAGLTETSPGSAPGYVCRIEMA
jgi:sugar lactone lactonase YvrE